MAFFGPGFNRSVLMSLKITAIALSINFTASRCIWTDFLALEMAQWVEQSPMKAEGSGPGRDFPAFLLSKFFAK